MLNIIINADDLGSSLACNKAIFQLMSLGKISSSTLMANGPHFMDAVQGAKQFPQYSFGVHLNLSQFKPLTDAEIFKKHRLINALDQFRFQKFILPTPQLIGAIRGEWYAQVARIIDHGIPISHFDSHNHVHTHLWMFPILKFLSQKFNIKKIRSKFGRHNYSLSGHILRRLLRQFRGIPHRFIQTYFLGLKMPDHFADIYNGFNFFSTHRITHPLTIELMCHPGVCGFQKDLPTLLEDYGSKICTPHRLISYHEL
ncbi:MAG: ChbG/HpnK family deacetylase [Puniceicoccales bacterium]|jgi:predicted glycoside hydrolase/deacetylase ChbG (UPF0249 family)|nr:ChbG/HpnK family deacetylase [Puniceicoccales bacterium]